MEVNIIKKIKHNIRLHFMRRELRQVSRQKQMPDFEDARSIGVLFDASSQETWQQTQQFVRQLENSGKKVVAMGFFRHKKSSPYLIEQMNMGFFQPADFSWNLKIHNPRLKQFVGQPFDILFDLSAAELFHTKYLAGISAAGFKVGVFQQENVEVFDLMIRMPAHYALSELMQHALHYLKMIKKPVSNVG